MRLVAKIRYILSTSDHRVQKCSGVGQALQRRKMLDNVELFIEMQKDASTDQSEASLSHHRQESALLI
jgi:hypothetical protein